jgi:hypothetical protein
MRPTIPLLFRIFVAVGTCFPGRCLATERGIHTNTQTDGRDLWSTPLRWAQLPYTVAYRPVTKQWLYKQRPFLGNSRNTHERSSRTMGLCDPFLSNGSVNTPTKIGVLLKTVFSIRSVQSAYTEEFNWESAVEFRSSKWVVVASWPLQGKLKRRHYELRCGALTSGQRRDHGSWWISTVLILLPGNG